MLSAAVEDYLKVIYKLQDDGPVIKTSIARALGVSSASVTGMVKRLARLKMVEHEPYKGVILTEAGEKIALEILRHHRLLETYLKEILGFSWEKMHAEAEHLEHHISEEFEARIDALLGYPTHDPHGHPIPTADLVLNRSDTVPLTDIAPGECVRVNLLVDSDAAMLEYLEQLGLVPNTSITVAAKKTLGGPLTIVVGKKHLVIDRRVADHIRVTAPTLQDSLAQERG